MPHSRFLAFDTSTDRLSVGLAVDGREWIHRGEGGANASSTLIPAIRRLLGEAGCALGMLDAIAFGRGPGSFTGLRTACAVAQGLAFGARRADGAALPLLPVDTLLAVAEQARFDHGTEAVVAALDARMDQVYWAHWRYRGGAWQGGVDAAADGFGLCAPEALPVPPGWSVAGNAAAAYGERLAPLSPAAVRLPALPDAAALLRLAPALMAGGGAVAAEDALPRYVRDKVAQTTAERAADRAARAAEQAS